MSDEPKSAAIYNLGHHPTSPTLLLDMVKANIPEIQSVVVSVIFRNPEGDELQKTYHSAAKNADLAWHGTCVEDYINRTLFGP